MNGKRNGKGKEYYNGELIFEGEFLDGERSGKGRLYASKYETFFRSQLMMNRQMQRFFPMQPMMKIQMLGFFPMQQIGNIQGKGYNNKEKLIFEGEFFDGHKNGKKGKNIMYIMIN